MNANNVIVIGKNGYIAQEYLHKHPEAISTSSSKETNTNYLNLENFMPEMLDKIAKKGDVLLLLASISSPDICTNQYEKAYAINVVGTSALIKCALQKEIKVLFFSSDTVYGETKEDVDENSVCNPVGEYAKMKQEIEQMFIDEANFKILRLSYVFSKKDKFTTYLIDSVKKDKKVEIFEPFDRSIVYLYDVIKAIDTIIQTWKNVGNIINICGKETVSRVEFVRMLSQTSLFKDLQYDVIIPSEYFFMNRPKTINMGSVWMQNLLQGQWHTIQEAISIEFN